MDKDSFIAKYINCKEYGWVYKNTGVVIATGIDLGKLSEFDLDSMCLPSDLKKNSCLIWERQAGMR